LDACFSSLLWSAGIDCFITPTANDILDVR
jgi:hypothetical protein